MDDRVAGIRPRPSVWRRMDITARYCFPAATTVLLLLLATLPLGLPGQAQLQPALILSCVFFWSVYRPMAMPPPAVFLIGLLADLLGMAPVGVFIFVLLAAHGVALRFRRLLIRQSFVFVWTVFVLVAFGGALLTWAFTSLLTLRLLPVAPALFQFVLSAAVYPALAALFMLAHRGIASPERA